MNKIEIICPYEVYDRISKNKPYGKNLRPYPKKILLEVLNLLKESEEYEKCSKLNDFIIKK